MYNTTLTTFAAMSAYRPQPVPIRLHLIRAHDTREILGASAACGWERVATHGVDVLWAPGDHETMFLGENLQATTALIRRCLQEEPSESPVTDGTIHAAN
jgi:surfactin synthase thioesterase subunit